MIGLFDDDGNRLPITWSTGTTEIVLNDDTDSTDWYRVDTVSVADQYDWVSDPHPYRDGMELYGARKVQKLVVIEGVIVAPSIAKLFDRKCELASAFDPAYLTDKYGPSSSVQDLVFQRPTTDTATWPTGLATYRYICRPRSSVFPISSAVTGDSTLFRIELICPNPSALATTYSDIQGLAGGSAASSYRTWPWWEFNMTGAGSALFQITCSGTVTINLSSCQNGDSIYVYPETRQIYKGSTEHPEWFVSGDWSKMTVLGTGVTVSYTNTTGINDSSMHCYYYKAWTA